MYFMLTCAITMTHNNEGVGTERRTGSYCLDLASSSLFFFLSLLLLPFPSLVVRSPRPLVL